MDGIESTVRDLNMNICPNRTSEARSLEYEWGALHEEIEIKCFYEGSSVLIIGENKIEVTAGDVVVINPYEFHATIDAGTDKNRGKYHLFMIPLDVFSTNGVDVVNLRKILLGNNMAFHTLFRNDERMFEILTRIVDEFEKKQNAYDVAIVGLLMEFFAVLTRKGIYSIKTSIKRDNMRLYRLLEPAIRHIRDNYKDQLTVEELADLCHVSKHYFCRAFKTLNEKTAMEYLMEYRLKIADVLLSSEDKTIEAISEACGFRSLSYFCRSYKKYYGLSPSQRRKN